MKLGGSRLIALLLLTASIAGCAPALQPLLPGTQVPRLVGKWEGIWSGTMTHPMILNVTEQKDHRVSGTVTYLPGGALTREVTDPMTGTVGLVAGKMVLVVNVGPAGGATDDFEFSFVGSDKLEGSGSGRRMIHRGPVSLTPR